MSVSRRGKKLGPASEAARRNMSRTKIAKRRFNVDIPDTSGKIGVIYLGRELVYAAKNAPFERIRLSAEHALSLQDVRYAKPLAELLASAYSKDPGSVVFQTHAYRETRIEAAARRYCALNPHGLSKKLGAVLVVGPSGSGKSWVCSQLEEPYVPWDSSRHGNSYCVKLETVLKTSQCRAVIGDPTVNVSWVVKLLKSRKVKTLMCVINEEPSIIQQRLRERGSAKSPNIDRVSRFKQLSKYAWFSGTSTEVLEFLKLKLRAVPGLR